jgi:hypothetical protein
MWGRLFIIFAMMLKVYWVLNPGMLYNKVFLMALLNFDTLSSNFTGYLQRWRDCTQTSTSWRIG